MEMAPSSVNLNVLLQARLPGSNLEIGASQSAGFPGMAVMMGWNLPSNFTLSTAPASYPSLPDHNQTRASTT